MCTIGCVLGKGFYSPWWFLLIRKSMTLNKMQVHQDKNFLIKYSAVMEFLAVTFLGLGWSFWEEGRIKISTWANSGIIEPSNFTCKMQSQLCSCPCTSNPRAVQCEPRIQHWRLCSWDMARPSRREIFQVGLVMDQNKVTHVLKSVELHLGYIWPNPWNTWLV